MIFHSAGNEQGNALALGYHALKGPELLLQFRRDQIPALAGAVHAMNQILRIRMTHAGVPPGLKLLRRVVFVSGTQHLRAGLNSSLSLRDWRKDPLRLGDSKLFLPS